MNVCKCAENHKGPFSHCSFVGQPGLIITEKKGKKQKNIDQLAIEARRAGMRPEDLA